MKNVLSFALATAFLAQGTFAKAAEPVELDPSSQWNLDYADEACRLGRSFGEGDQKVVLVFAKYAPGPDMEIIARGKPLSSKGASGFSYRWGSRDKVDVERPLFGNADDGSTIWQFSGTLLTPDTAEKFEKGGIPIDQIKAAEDAASADIESFTMQVGRRAPVTLETGSLGKGFEAMDQCLDSLVESWGFDPARQSMIVTAPQPVGKITNWFNSRDYPSTPLRNDVAGAVRFRLAIDEGGAITDCTIQSAYSDPAFAEKVCSEFRRNGKFKPAVDAAGNGIATFWAATVVFVPSA